MEQLQIDFPLMWANQITKKKKTTNGRRRILTFRILSKNKILSNENTSDVFNGSPDQKKSNCIDWKFHLQIDLNSLAGTQEFLS